MIKEQMVWNAKWTIEKYGDEFGFNNNTPYEISVIEKNMALNTGINLLWALACGGTGTKFDSSNAYLGVGDSLVAESATQTGLQAVTNKYYKGMMVGYPIYGTAQKATWKAEFGGTEANFAWNEFTISNGSTDGAVSLNRKVSSQGVKTSGQLWTLQLDIVLS